MTALDFFQPFKRVETKNYRLLIISILTMTVDRFSLYEDFRLFQSLQGLSTLNYFYLNKG